MCFVLAKRKYIILYFQLFAKVTYYCLLDYFFFESLIYFLFLDISSKMHFIHRADKKMNLKNAKKHLDDEINTKM